MAESLTWIPSAILCFEVNASAQDLTYSITRHTLSGRTIRAHVASVGGVTLGRFAEGAAGLKAAKRACQAHVSAA
jgi:hypothetical protein